MSNTGLLTDGDWVESKDQDECGSIRLTQLADIGDGWFKDRSRRFLRPDQADRLGCTLLEPGDVMIARMPDPLGRACVFPGLPQPAVTVVDVCVVRVGTLDVSSRWLAAFINSPDFRVAIAGEQQGSTRKRISKGALTQLSLPVPPSREQVRIAEEVDSYLSRLDAAIATLEAAQAKLKAYRASVLKAAVEGRLVPTEAELARAEGRDYEPADVLLKRILAERRRRWEEAELAKLKAAGRPPRDDRWKAKYEEPKPPATDGLPELPAGWCWASAEQLFWDGGYGTSEKCSPHGDGPAVLRIPNVSGGHITLDDLKFASVGAQLEGEGAVAVGDFLFIRTNGSRSLIGRGALVRRDHTPKLYFASYLIRLRLVTVDEVPSWFALAWSGPSVRGPLVEAAASSAGQHNVSLSSARGFPIPLPPGCEQSRILAEVERLESAAGAAESELSTNTRRSARLRQAVLKWAFEGKLVDQDPTDESTEALLARIRAERAQTVTPKRTRRARNAR